MGVRGDIYPGYLGSYSLLGENVKSLVAACALPEALVPLILRKKQAFRWRVYSVQICMSGKFLVFTNGSSTVSVTIVLCPRRADLAHIKGKELMIYVFLQRPSLRKQLVQ